MHPTVQLSQGFEQAPRARSALGVDHPLVLVLERQDVVRRDVCVLTAFALLLVPAAALGWPPAPWLLAAAGATLVGLALGAAAVRARRRQLAVELIVDGHEHLPVTAVRAERERLMDPAHRRMLARSLELIAAAARDHPAWLRTSTLPCCPRTISAALPQLTEVQRLLTSEAPSVRGVALTQRLLVNACSPLHGSDPQRLCEELRRIAHLLQRTSASTLR